MNKVLDFKHFENMNSDWKIIDGKLSKKFKFSDYSDVLDFVQRVGKIAQKINHHPDMVVTYSYVLVTIFDHEAGKISDKCYKFVEEVNKL